MNSIENNTVIKRSWADYDSDDDLNSYLTHKESNCNSNIDITKYLKKFNIKIIDKDGNEIIDTNDEINNTNNKIIDKDTKTDNTIDEILNEVNNDKDLIDTKLNNNENNNTNNNTNSNNNSNMVYTVENFIELIKQNKKPNVDFMIHKSAHCFHTYNGTICYNVKKCKKIHIQRCIYNNKCNNKKCTFIHEKNMLNNEAKLNFKNTINEYNKIKQNKQIK
jgi:hypothetical protein